jgi:hypothetical protein
VWRESFDRHFREEIDSGINYVYTAYVQYEARDISENDLKPAEMPFERLRLWAGITWLEGMIEGGGSSDRLAPEASGMTSTTLKLAEHMNSFLMSREEHFVTRGDGHHELMHARSRLDPPEGMLGSGHRLTPAQMDLMIYILLSSYENLEGERPIIWSPKAYLRRSPTKTEAATLSRRVSALVDRSLIKRSGREVSVTDSGRELIRAYTVKRRHDKHLLKVRLVLELNETGRNLEALELTRDVASRHERHDLVRRNGKGPLYNLLNAEMSRRDNLIQQLKEIAD